VLVRATAAGVTSLDHTILSGGHPRAKANAGAGQLGRRGHRGFRRLRSRGGKPRSVKPIVERVYPLGEASEALRHLIEDRPFGKVVLAVIYTPASAEVPSSSPKAWGSSFFVEV